MKLYPTFGSIPLSEHLNGKKIVYNIILNMLVHTVVQATELYLKVWVVMAQWIRHMPLV